jgi:hypothetical protein
MGSGARGLLGEFLSKRLLSDPYGYSLGVGNVAQVAIPGRPSDGAVAVFDAMLAPSEANRR